MSTIEVVTCSGCGAPLPEVPTMNRPTRCEYCEITNVFRPPRVDPKTGELIQSEDELSERDYQIYMQQQEILSRYSGELVGDEITKIRLALPIGSRVFQVLLVLDNYPNDVFIDVSPDPRQLIGPLTELSSIKNWNAGHSRALDVIQELEEKLRKALGADVPTSESERSSALMTEKKKKHDHDENDPLFLEIMSKFEAIPEKKGLKVLFYSPAGEEMVVFIKRKKKYPVQLLGKFHPLVDGIIEDYEKGRISLIQALTDIERLIYA